MSSAPTTKHGKQRLLTKLQEQNGLCAICSKPATITDSNIDHIKPKSLGGSNGWGNLQAAHIDCNLQKGNGNQPAGDRTVFIPRIPKDRQFSTANINRRVRKDTGK